VKIVDNVIKKQKKMVIPFFFNQQPSVCCILTQPTLYAGQLDVTSLSQRTSDARDVLVPRRPKNAL